MRVAHALLAPPGACGARGVAHSLSSHATCNGRGHALLCPGCTVDAVPLLHPAASCHHTMSATTAPPLVLVLFKGHPSSGKSSLARLVCRQLRWPLLDKDDARDALQPHHAAQQQQQQQGQALVLLDANAVSYDIMFAFAATQLSLGVSAALDCPFARPELFDRAAALAARHGAVLAVVDCVAGDEAVWRQRLEARGRAQAGGPQGHKPCTWSDVQQLLQRYGGSHKWSTDGSRRLEHHCTVDTTALSLQQAGEQVLTFLGAVQVKQQAQQQQQQQQTVGVRAG